MKMPLMKVAEHCWRTLMLLTPVRLQGLPCHFQSLPKIPDVMSCCRDLVILVLVQIVVVLTTHRSANLCCQCGASLVMRLVKVLGLGREWLRYLATSP